MPVLFLRKLGLVFKMFFVK